MFTFEIPELACRITFDLNGQRQPDTFVVRNLDGATLPADSPQYAPAVQWAQALYNSLPPPPRFPPRSGVASLSSAAHPRPTPSPPP